MRPAEFTCESDGLRLCFPPTGIYLVEDKGGSCLVRELSMPGEDASWYITETYIEARRELYEAMTWDPSRMLNSEWPDEE